MPKKIQDDISFTDAANAAGLSRLAAGKKTSSIVRIPIQKEKRDIEQYDAPARDVKLVARRRWQCMNRKMNCKGRLEFVGWSELLDKPICPKCNSEMNWYQWLVVKK